MVTLPWRRRIPVVRQLAATDCGAACLAMALAHHGREVPLQRVQAALGTGRDGADAAAIVRAAAAFGLRGRGLSLEVDELDQLPAGSILHWNFDHFVVYEGPDREGARIVDPALGRRLVSLARLRRSFTGIALSFEPVALVDLPARAPSPTLRVLRDLLLRHRGHMSRIVGASVLLRAIALTLPALTGLVVDRVVLRTDNGLLVAIAFGIAVVTGLQFATTLLRGLFLVELRARVDLSLNVGFLDHLLSLPFPFLQRRSAGDLLMRINNHAVLREAATTSAVTSVLDGGFAATYLVLLALASPPICAVAVVLGATQVAVFAWSATWTRDRAADELAARARSQAHLSRLVSGVETLKAQGAEHDSVTHWSDLFVHEVNAGTRRGVAAAVAEAAKSALRALGPAAILVVGGAQVTSGAQSLGGMLELTALTVGFLGPLDALVEGLTVLLVARSHVDRADDVLLTPPEREPGVAPTPRLAGGIALRGVSFSHGEDEEPVLRDIDLTVPAGSCVAVVGASGSGKSTLVKVLLGLYPATSGEVSYDGRPLRTLDPVTLRRQIGLVPQTTHLFSGTVRTNLALARPDAPFADLVAAARRAGIHELLARLPLGYDTPIGDSDTFSGGERQRLALARALVGNPAILILDEATNALDTETEARIVANLKELRCTRVVIAHRLSTVAGADHIVVLDRGRLVEQGTPAELLSRGGRYRALVEAQA